MVGTIKGEDVVLQNFLVVKEKGIVMDLVMEANMMDTVDAEETLSVAATTAESLDLTTMIRMTAVNQNNQQVKYLTTKFY